MATLTAPAVPRTITAPVPGTIRLSSEIRRYLRDLVGDRDGWACFYCGRDVIPPPRGRQYTGAEARHLATLDHWQPVARGGTWELSNLVMACMPCNEEKRAFTGPEYLAVLAYRRAHPAGRDRLSILALVRSQLRWDRSPDRRWSPIARLAHRTTGPGPRSPRPVPRPPEATTDE